MIEGFRVLDADAHVIEPAHVFRDWQPPGTMPIDLPPDTPMVPCGDIELLRDQFDHGFDAPSYLRAMDAQGIDAVVLYPSIGLFVPYLPHLSPSESANACASYNEWVADYCTTDPQRMAAVGLVPLADVELAVSAARHAATLGLVGVLARPNHVYGRNLGDPAYDPLWHVCVELGLVVSVHEGLGLRGATIGADRFDGFAARHALSHPMEQMAAMTSLVLDGALERHEQLRVAFLESATGWLPYWLHRLDEHREWMQPGRVPASELFGRQCVISTEAEDDCLAATIARVGADHVLWASDFPHPDARFPDAGVTFLRTCSGQSIALRDITDMLWAAPISFYLLADRFTAAAP